MDDRNDRRGAAAARWRTLAALMLPLPACIIDGGDKRCDANQVLVEQGSDVYCACNDTSIPSAAGFGCTACSDNEVAASGACVCKDGYTKLTPASACTEIQVGEVVLGQPCSSDAECGGSFSHCATEDGGYCTSTGCTSDADCSSPWYCEGSGNESYCHKPPTGLGISCTSDADCAGFDAAYCEPFQSHTCMINNCVSDPNVCKSWACCDLTMLAGTSLCVPQDQLTNGKCFDGSAPVTP